MIQIRMVDGVSQIRLGMVLNDIKYDSNSAKVLINPFLPPSIHPPTHSSTFAHPSRGWNPNPAGLAALEQENGHLSQVEVDKVAGLMRHIRSKVPTNDAMPCWVVFLVELLLDVCRNVLERSKRTECA